MLNYLLRYAEILKISISIQLQLGKRVRVMCDYNEKVGEGEMTSMQHKLFIMWASNKLAISCETESELRDKAGNEVVDELKLRYINHMSSVSN